MIFVVTGNEKLKFKVQGQRCSHDKPVRIRIDHDIQAKLDNGTLKKYVPPVPEKKPVPILKKKEKKIINK